ncbi:multicomponent Na+:H+ antiporter subunit G [Methylohalomonas lacus]|uniref:Multicomponent Na+:H+ antiporter subunit G n=1 Tax=Methylohalomonas lacus TaxID=398773 RepID=A0AAE3HKQ6_9GAMM|nr:monovalent cation/H(+) antiporter subunit G [Methylohalomonas lacus]MCS3902926.1 multicomponent Na+:H+ antiporter subunit G [Methylohalomonas lacus]
MSELVVSILLLLGAALILIAAIGVVRMPDLMLRMHATSKAGALGGGLLAVAGGLHFADTDVMVRAIAIVVFVVMTAPIAAHAIARAGYFVGVPFWDRTLKDELRERLDTRDHMLRSGLEDKPRE